MQNCLLLLVLLAAEPSSRPFAIEVVDDQTGRGVPLVELKTTSGITYVTDSAGLVAFDEPGLMDQQVFFHVKSHGYEAPRDGFGFRGVRLDVRPGGSATVRIKRLNVAERLYRVTGQGIYRDSVLLGRETPIDQPLLNAKVAGCDSVVNTVYRGRIHWFWGDTNQVAYPLGLFHVPGATSELPSKGGLDPDRGVNLKYFTGDNGFARAMAKMPGEGPTWIWGLAAVPDAGGRERLLCGYVKIRPPMVVYRRGICEWDDESNEFRQVAEYEPDVPLYPNGQAFVHGEGDQRHVYFATPFPLVRTRATAESYKDITTYEAFTCLKTGTTLEQPAIDRDEEGRPRYAWRKDTPPIDPQQQARLIREGHLQPHEGLLQLRDIETGKEVLGHAGSVHWNEYRKRFVMIVCQIYGTSLLGETWYAEADSPVGPWVYARKVVTHDKYSFYNPKHHPMFDAEGGRRIYFEGTYTHTFSGNEHPTPRYDYNQIMYGLDLADQRLVLPQEVGTLRVPTENNGTRSVPTTYSDFAAIPYFALDRPTKMGVPTERDSESGRLRVAENGDNNDRQPLFWALPAETNEPGITVPLYEYVADDGREPRYDVRDDLVLDGYRRQPRPICRVWPSPYQAGPN